MRGIGHKSGRLFATDHIDAFYDDVVAMAGESSRDWAEEALTDDFNLPPGSLVIASRQRLQFEFISCAKRDDSPVWGFNTWDWKITKRYESICEWLSVWCDEAERVMKTDYFERNPNGTLMGRHRIA